MAKYTMELRQLQSEFYENMQDYPLFDESYREQLNDKIYHACRFREIGYETPEIFFEELKEWLEVNMPEYNHLYKANEAALKLTPTQRTKIKEVFEMSKSDRSNYTSDGNEKVEKERMESSGSTTSFNRQSESQSEENLESTVNDTQITTDTETGNAQRDSKSYHSDFPQGNLTDEETVDTQYYSTGDFTRDDENTTTTSDTTVEDTTQENRKNNKTNNDIENSDTEINANGNSSDKTKSENHKNDFKMGSEEEQHTKETTGNTNLTDFELIEMYRKSFVNVDAKLIKALKKALFMNIW